MIKTIQLSLLLAVIFILTACGETYNGDLGADNSTPQKNNVQVPADTVQNYKKLSCKDVGDKENQAQCERTVNDVIANIINNEAVIDFDTALCKKLPEERVQQCIRVIEETGVKGPVSREEQQIFSKAIAPVLQEIQEDGEASPALLTESFDPSKCAELKTPGYKEYCEKQIAERQEMELFREISMGKSSKRCGELKNEHFKQACSQHFGIPYTPPVMEQEPAPDVTVQEEEPA